MSPQEAIDTMMAHVKDASPNYVSIIWPDVPDNKPPDGLWVRPTIRHASGGQSTLANATGSKRNTMTGVLIIQCFTPIGSGSVRAIELSTIFIEYFARVRNSKVWYRDQQFAEIGKDGPSLQYNFATTFEYDMTFTR